MPAALHAHWDRARAALLAPRDIASLVAFRGAFGLIVVASSLRFLAYSWIDGMFVVPEFRFPARGRVQSQLGRAKSVISRGEKVLQALPLRGKQAELSARLETKRMEVERALGTLSSKARGNPRLASVATARMRCPSGAEISSGCGRLKK